MSSMVRSFRDWLNPSAAPRGRRRSVELGEEALQAPARRVVVMVNPVAGRGRGPERADAVASRLRAAGHRPRIVASRLEPTETWLDPALEGADVLAIVGGDGAVNMASGAAARTGVPIWQIPTGTENLFAREHAMRPSAVALLRALVRPRVRRVDLGRANDHPFVLMLSVGFDAEVVWDLAARRRGAITHLSYAMPILRQVRRWRAPTLAIDVDGEPLVRDRTGMVVVANSREYGGRLDPAWEARMDDGRLDVVFLPMRAAGRLIGVAASYRLGRQARDAGAVRRLGRSVEIRSDLPVRPQVDGDAPYWIGSRTAGDALGVDRLTVEVDHGALPVLLPGDPPGRRRRDAGER